MLEGGVPVLGLAEIGLGIEIDIAGYTGEFLFAGFFNMLQGDIDNLTDISLIGLIIDIMESAAFRQHEALALQTAQDGFFVITVLFYQDVVVFLPDIGDLFDEQHDQNIVFILRRIDRPPKGIAGIPEYAIDFILINFGGHTLFSCIS